MLTSLVCHKNYRFTDVYIGQYGSGNDRGVLKNSEMLKKIWEWYFWYTLANKIPKIEKDLPFYKVLNRDKIFPLKFWLQRPFPSPLDDKSKKKINYRLPRARRTIKNISHIFAARWRIFRQPIKAETETVQLIVLASVCLHNFLQLTFSTFYTPSGSVVSELWICSIKEGDWGKIVETVTDGLRGTAWKVSVFGVILACIFPHSDGIRTRIILNLNTFYAMRYSKV